MDNITDDRTICQTCLSCDRVLFELLNLESLLTNVNISINSSDPKAGICWECKAIITKFSKFKNQALEAQKLLTSNVEEKVLSKLKNNTKCSYDFVYNYEDTNLSDTELDKEVSGKDKGSDDLINDSNLNTIDKDNKKETCENGINSTIATNDSIESYNDFDSINDNDSYSDTDNNDTEIVTVNKKEIQSSTESVKEKKIIKDKIEKVAVNKKTIESSTQSIKKKKIIGDKIEKVTVNKKKIKPSNESVKKKKIEKVTVNKKKIQSSNESDKYQRIFKDIIETIKFTEEEMLRSRDSKKNHPNFKKVPYKCDSCVVGFMTEDKYLQHVKNKHDESIGPHSCDVCSLRFADRKPLSVHFRRHYTMYRCALCRYEAADRNVALNHCRAKHGNDEVGAIHCGQCDATVESAEKLTEHISSAHMLECTECGEKFKKKSILRTHKKRAHSTTRAFTCDVCKKTFNTRSRLETHLAGHDPALALKLVYCAVCKVQYKNIFIYRNHLRNNANHSERQYECKDCNKNFASKVYWKRHCDFYHLKKTQFKCDDCDKRFISDCRLRTHRQVHHGLSRSRDHACDACEKRFYTPSSLRAHQLTHSERRSFVCAHCGDTFRQRPALSTHVRLVHERRKRGKTK